MTSLRILGPVQAWEGEQPLPLGGPKQVKLLAFLLLHANQAVSADVLVDAVWGSARSVSDNRLPMAIGRLRKVLAPLDGSDGTILRTVSRGYLLTVAPNALDANLFEEAARDGRRALEDGRPALAVQLLDVALALWRGPPLAEVGFEDFAQPEIRRLDELRLTALETRLEADLALGHHAQLVGELDALLTDQPTRERVAGLLMLALYRSGRQADALDTYRRTRAHLVEELGIEPGRELHQLHEAMLGQDSKLDLTPPGGVPGDKGRVSAPILVTNRHNLPAARTSFVGRDETLVAIERWVQTSRVVTLTGVGGVGKTRLALQVAERSLERWPDGVWLVELATVDDASAVAEAVASTLSLDVSHARAPLDEIANRVEERHLLLVMDNCEHVLDACAMLAARIARGRSASRLLATSRAPLAVAGERVVRVSPLPVSAGAGSLSDAVDADSDAVKLFLQRAHDARADVAIDGAQLDAIGELCRALDGIPLAIELAASRVRAMTPAQILAHLTDRLSLSGYERDREARHRDLATAIKWSYDLLPERVRQVFRRLCVFPAPFTLSAAEQVVGREGVAESILELVDNSLLVVAEQAAGTRYRMLDTLREFGLRQVGERGDETETQERYLDWACELVQTALAEAESRGRTEVLPHVEIEYRNLLSALTTPDGVDKRLRLVSELTALLFASTRLREIRRALEDVLDSAGDDNTTEVRCARLWMGRVMCKLGELDAARSHLATTAAYAESADDRLLGAAIAADQALVEIKGGRRVEARRFLDRSAALGADIDDHVRSYRLLVEAQMSYDLLGDLEGARELYRACLDQVRRHGPAPQLITALAALAELSVDLDDPETAERCATEVLAITDPVADAYSRGGAVLALGRAALRAGRPMDAIGWLIDGAKADIRRGSMETPETLESLAHAIAADGRPVDGATMLGAAAAMRQRLGLDPLEREQEHIDAAVAAIRAQLPERDLQQGLHDGERLTERALMGLVDRVTPQKTPV